LFHSEQTSQVRDMGMLHEIHEFDLFQEWIFCIILSNLEFWCTVYLT